MATRYDVKYFSKNGVGWNYEGHEQFNLYELAHGLYIVSSDEMNDIGNIKALPTSEVDEIEFQYLSGCNRIVITVEGAYDE